LPQRQQTMRGKNGFKRRHDGETLRSHRGFPRFWVRAARHIEKKLFILSRKTERGRGQQDVWSSTGKTHQLLTDRAIEGRGDP